MSPAARPGSPGRPVRPGDRRPLPPLVTVLAGLLAGLMTLAALSGCSAGSAVTSRASGSTSAPASASGSGSAGGTATCPAPSPDTPGEADSHLPLRSLCALPVEATGVWRSISTGGPFRYSRDGIVFNNAERRLPQHQRGYYHEYTVPTPGSTDRGARRLIAGQSRELFYTGDHYGSFVVVDPTAAPAG